MTSEATSSSDTISEDILGFVANVKVATGIWEALGGAGMELDDAGSVFITTLALFLHSFEDREAALAAVVEDLREDLASLDQLDSDPLAHIVDWGAE